MYNANDKSRAILEIQRMLKTVSEEDNIGYVALDGVFSSETELAVKAFQRLYGLTESGEVDLSTFRALNERANKIKKDRADLAKIPSPEKFPLKIGESSDTIGQLNGNLRGLREFYRDLVEAPIGNFFSRETESAVRDMQRIFRENPSGIVNPRLYLRLLEELLEREKFRDMSVLKP